MEFLGSLISAGSSLLGGALNRESSEKIAQQNIANQRDFAQHGISWKVADAQSAGISPLAALGSSTSSFSNVVGSDAMGEGIAQAGQDVGKAFRAAGSHEERQLSLAGAKLDIERKQLDNDLVRTEIASKLKREATQPPAMPLVGPDIGNVIEGQSSSKKADKFVDAFSQKQTPMALGGHPIFPAANWSDSNVVQNRWGDTLQDIIAPFTADEDMARSMGQRIPSFLLGWGDRGARELNAWLAGMTPQQVIRWIRSSAEINAPWKGR